MGVAATLPELSEWTLQPYSHNHGQNLAMWKVTLRLP